ncbi:MAG: hypothetical protein Q7S12_03860 [bacterium]|nr:hypothetical protein [bacterium]
MRYGSIFVVGTIICILGRQEFLGSIIILLAGSAIMATAAMKLLKDFVS